MLEAYDSTTVPAVDRLEYVREAARRQPVPIELIADPGIDIRASMRVGEFDKASVIDLRSVSSGPLQMRRTLPLIRRSDPEAYRFVFCVEGRMRYEQDGRQMEFGPRLAGVLGTFQPFCWDRYEARPTSCRLMMVTVPRHALTVPPQLLGPLLCRPIDGAKRLRTAIAGLLMALIDRPAGFQQLSGATIGDFLVTALDALLAAQCGMAVPAGLPRRAMMLQVEATILEKLGDPSLRPAAIAGALNISERTLHNITAAHDTTVMETVWSHRIERAHRDIVDPAQWDTRFVAIGRRLGFPQPSQLTRAIRAIYDGTPTELRSESQAVHRREHA